MAEKKIMEQTALKTVYREGNTVVKSFAASHSKADVLNEAFIHACVEESGVSVPKFISVMPMDGGYALTIEYVEGKTLEEMMKENPSKRTEYLEKLVEIQLEVASHKAPRLRNTRLKMADAIESLKDEIDPSTRYELLSRLHGMKNHTKLCHGDLVPSNIILHDDGSYCVLDWSHATQGNAGADAAITYLRFSLENQEMADEYLHIFSEKADMAIQYIQEWMPVVAAAQLVHHKPEEKELLERWINVAQYQ